MNIETKMWAAKVGSPNISEAVQRIAFSFGYKWRQFGNSIHAPFSKVLYFNEPDKIITWGDDPSLNKGIKVCTSLEEVVEAFKNPDAILPSKVTVGNSTIYRDGSAKISGVILTKTELDKLVDAYNQFFGGEKKQKLSKISFVYNSPTSGRKVRKLYFIDEGDTEISGLDIDDNNVFKQFRKDWIDGVVTWHGLSKTKDQ